MIWIAAGVFRLVLKYKFEIKNIKLTARIKCKHLMTTVELTHS